MPGPPGFRRSSAERRSPARLGAWIRATVVASVVAAVLAGCASQGFDGNDPSGAFTGLFSGFGANDLKAKRTANTQPYGTVNGQPQQGTQIYPGTNSRDPNNPSVGDGMTEIAPGVRQDSDGFQLNFENADAAAICKTILGDILQLNYTVDARVSGQINLSSARPVPKASLVRLLETSLKAINASIIKEGSLYRVIPASEGVGSGQMEFATSTDGYGTTVIPVKYVSVQTVSRILENFATRPGAIKADPGTNLIIVQGTAQERRSALDAASVVDTDLMKEQSVGIFPLANSAPDALIAELNKIMETGEGGIGQNMVQFQPMVRMNAVLVVTRRKAVLDTVTRWIHRLDRSDPSAAGVKVYRLKYAQAKLVAAMINDIIGGRSSNTGQKDTDSLQPSSNTTGNLVQSPASSATPGTPGFGTTTQNSAQPGQASATQSSAVLGQSVFGNQNTPNGPGSSDTASSSSPSGQGLMPKVRVTPDVNNNSLLIVANAQEYKIVEAAIRELDKAPVQVAIEATIAEITLTDQLNYGVQSYLNSHQLGLSKGDHFSFGFNNNPSTGTTAIQATVPGGNLILGQAANPLMVLDALHAVTNVKVLSSPSLVVIDNQQAVLQVGDQVAVKTQSSQAVVAGQSPIIDSIEYKDTGIILRVLPRIHANGIVNLDIEQEISNVVDNTGTQDGLTPTISQRKVKSSIAVANGQTVLLAGLISEKQSRSRTGLPGIMQWKLIGDILSVNTNSGQRTELIIFIKPRIIRDQVDAQSVAEEFRARLTAMRPAPGPEPKQPK